MTQRNQREQELLAKAAQYLPGSSTGNTNYPDELKFLVREGKGGRVWDVSGNEYIDWLMGSGPMILGHAHPAVTEAVSQAVGRGSTFFTTNEQAVMLAEELVNAVPCAEQVRFTTSGTDACFQAMRVARAFTGKEKVLKFEGGFHGTSDYAMMSVFASAATEFPQAEANSGGIPRAISDLMLISQFNDLDTTGGHQRRPQGRDCRGYRGTPATDFGSESRVPGWPAETHRRRWPAADLRRGGHRVPAGLRWSPGVLRRYARPVLGGQDHGRWIRAGGDHGSCGCHVGLRPGRGVL